MKTYFLWLVFIIDQLLSEVSCHKDYSKSNEHGVSLDGSDFVTEHTFIALIDIVFTDGSKRVCTGAIIDDTVVISAAHCFIVSGDPHVTPELTLSFVVIGTRKMFDSGYEQYLPIERILSHPDHRGWKSDLSLVFTFAAMTADKPGNIVHLAKDKLIERDTNITVVSWGSTNKHPSSKTEQDKNPKPKKTTAGPCSDADSNSRESTKQYNKDDKNENIGRTENKNKIEERGQKIVDRGDKEVELKDKLVGPEQKQVENNKNHEEERIIRPENKDHVQIRDEPSPKNYRVRDHEREIDRKLDQKVSRLRKVYSSESEDDTVRHNYRSTHFSRMSRTTAFSRYLNDGQKAMVKSRFHKRSRLHKATVSSSSGSAEEITDHVRRHKSWFDGTSDVNEKNLDKYIDAIYEKFRSKKSAPMVDFKKHFKHARDSDSQIESIETGKPHLKTYYKNWRRSMGNQHNRVFVGEFNMIKLSECKRLMERAVSSMFDISDGNDFVCYTSDEHFITEQDSGAPAVKLNRLVAITLGGFECEGERVALGLKMSCYCPWIASNIPNGKNLTCCTDCCVDKSQPKWMVI